MNQSRPNQIAAQNWEQYAAAHVIPAHWTAIIPAAGKGSRLGFDKPKILFPVAGRMIVEWLLDFLLPNCKTMVFVLSPGGQEAVREELERLIPGRYRIVIQAAPTGMGDAVDLAMGSVDTQHVAVVWGDQVALRRGSVDACLRLHQGSLAPDLTCPTVIRPDPYIHIERDGMEHEGRIIGLRQKREGDLMPAEGESDTGFFCLRTASLRRLLAELRKTATHGDATGEFNFLPVIPLAAREGIVITPRLMALEETVGVNSREDADLVGPFLRRTRGN